ncbi:MAG TPA: class I SAM-dependent methyltransferase [Candidatus Limnocylindrales bacterium]|nr:class I SAM-dependent methyltransferase [Candidatus Limnocylindrales bacterium]
MTASPDRHLYPDFLTEFYDQLPLYSNRRDGQFYLKAALGQGGPVLELGCGTGRILLPMARAGLEVTGLDLSPQMLARFHAKLAMEPTEVRCRVELIQGDMTSFDLGRKFPLITIPFRPFQHLIHVADQIACLRAVERHLALGGQLILDCFQTDPRRLHDPAFLQESENQPEFQLPDGRRMSVRDRTAAFHRAEQFNDLELIYVVTHPDGHTERFVYAFPMHYFFRYEVEHLLARCGLRVVALYGDFDGGALTDASMDMIFVAEKARE